ncbi:hypothetical protein N7460_006874 [Penicillium canescens]|uniref:Uncharacterized protein n=1 Tax=Penicillium canescens TaxID=5083 RepID=A0AAD6IBC0_PENCN|nr:hypothetical protein N7460_006874 [Penicillium canescens]
MSTRYKIIENLICGFLCITTWAAASLCWAIVGLAHILQDRAKSDIVIPGKAYPDKMFISLMDRVVRSTGTFGAVSTLIALFETVIITTRWRREYDQAGLYFVGLEAVQVVIMLAAGGYVSGEIHGYQTSFQRFQAGDKLAFYNIMYYGGLGQVGYGGLLILVLIMLLLIACLSAHGPCHHGRSKNEATEAMQGHEKYGRDSTEASSWPNGGQVLCDTAISVPK